MAPVACHLSPHLNPCLLARLLKLESLPFGLVSVAAREHVDDPFRNLFVVVESQRPNCVVKIHLDQLEIPPFLLCSCVMHCGRVSLSRKPDIELELLVKLALGNSDRLCHSTQLAFESPAADVASVEIHRGSNLTR